MDKVRYVKKLNGVVEEYFEVLNFQIDYSCKIIHTSILHLKIINGCPEVKHKSYTITDVYDTSNIYKIDSNWNEKSDPPKPDGFILEDPETWGGLSWEQIPKIIPNKNYFSNLFSYIQSNASLPAYIAIEEFILNALIEKGDLPLISEGFVFEIVSVVNVW